MARAGPSRRCSARSRSREQRPATARVLSPFQFLERTGQDLSLLELTVGFDSYGGPRAKVKAVAHLGMRRSDAWSHSSSQSSKSVAELCDLSKNSYPGKAAMTKKMPTMMNIWRTVNFPRTTSSAVHGMAKSARIVRAAKAMSHRESSSAWFQPLTSPPHAAVAAEGRGWPRIGSPRGVPGQMNPLETLPTLIAATRVWEWTGWGLYLSRFRPLATEAPFCRIVLSSPRSPSRPAERPSPFSPSEVSPRFWLVPVGSDQRTDGSTNPTKDRGYESEEERGHETGDRRPQPAIESCIRILRILGNEGEGKADYKSAVPDNESASESLRGIPQRVSEDHRGQYQSQARRIEWQDLGAFEHHNDCKEQRPCNEDFNGD